ncbi:hypothetical protein [Idiomarina aquatica]|uniref:Uncharacterized protein n=1 Tax=Idiomarina aquatica TaxID=1327752 RepID=A0AA94EEW7_9GAMM|nr:hypothetical protein [Idiomarina aquatica]RUO44542.1 hypothetical protein CWE23_00400 [Idiomarina aquatica]
MASFEFPRNVKLWLVLLVTLTSTSASAFTQENNEKTEQAKTASDNRVVASNNPTAGLPLTIININRLEIPNSLSNTQVSPAWWQDYRAILSILAMILSLSTIGYNVWSRSQDKKQSIHDEFWLRKVIFPKIIEPLQDFWMSSRKIHIEVFGEQPSQSSLTQPKIDEYNLKIWNHIGAIRDSLQALSMVSKNLVQQAEAIIDEYEEDVNDITVFPREHASHLHFKLLEFLKNDVHHEYM